LTRGIPHARVLANAATTFPLGDFAQRRQLVPTHGLPRAIARSDSPLRNRVSPRRYWNISILLRPTGTSTATQSCSVAIGRFGSRRPSFPCWLPYADPNSDESRQPGSVAPLSPALSPSRLRERVGVRVPASPQKPLLRFVAIQVCRKPAGAIAPRTPWLLHAENSLAPVRRKLSGSHVPEDDTASGDTTRLMSLIPPKYAVSQVAASFAVSCRPDLPRISRLRAQPGRKATPDRGRDYETLERSTEGDTAPAAKSGCAPSGRLVQQTGAASNARSGCCASCDSRRPDHVAPQHFLAPAGGERLQSEGLLRSPSKRPRSRAPA
jgi:hypothetical protein